jgi:WD40 repeat protein
VWDLSTTKVRSSRALHKGRLYSLAFCPGGKALISTSFDEDAKRFEAKYCDIKEDKDRLVAQGAVAALSATAVSLNGKLLAIAHPVGNNDRDPDDPGQVILWDVASGKELRHLNGHTGWINRVTFTPDGAALASGGADKTIRLWDVASGEEKMTLHGHAQYIGAVSISPDGRLLASSDLDGMIKLWDISNGKERASFQADPSRGEYLHVFHTETTFLAYSQDGKTLVSGHGTAKYWDVAKVLEQYGKK